MTITRFVFNEQSKHPESRGDFSILLSHIALGCKFVCSAVNKGEEQKKLDVLSNEVFVKALVSSGRTCILVSDEDEEVTFVDPALRGKYGVVFDPLDGSSNIDCGVSIGTYCLYFTDISDVADKIRLFSKLLPSATSQPLSPNKYHQKASLSIFNSNTWWWCVEVFPSQDSTRRRRAGDLFHPSSLPGPYGIGDFGAAAFRFLDWLHSAGYSDCQVLLIQI